MLTEICLCIILTSFEGLHIEYCFGTLVSMYLKVLVINRNF